MQIRSRLTFQFLLIVASIMLVAMCYIRFQFKVYLEDEFHNTLRSKGYMTAEMIVGKVKPLAALTFVPEEGTGQRVGNYRENVAIYNTEGHLVYSFNALNKWVPADKLRAVKGTVEARFASSGYDALAWRYTNRHNVSFVVVSEAIFEPEYLLHLTHILVWVFLAFIVIVALSGWFFAGQALAPVSKIMNELDSLLPSDMNRRLPTANQHDELSRLAMTFNRLLDRIQQAFKAQRLFLSNISHELKNPLNVIITQLEVALAKARTEQEYRQTLKSVLGDIKELNEVSNKLMQLAKITADESEIVFEPLRIDEMIWQAKAMLLKAHPDYKITFRLADLPGEESQLYIQGNEQLLRTALLNLIDNGCKFSPDKSVVVHLTFPETGGACIEIEDRGPGIAEEELPLVFEPFYRSAKTSKVKGSGVGLSLVNSIMMLHHIKIRVSNPSGQAGTVFKLEFPLVA